MAARRRRDAVVGLDHAAVVRRDDVQVDHAEARDLLGFAFVEDLEVLRAEAADRFAVAGVDVDRHLDLEDEGAVVELPQVVGALGERGRGGAEEAGQGEGRERPHPARFRRVGRRRCRCPVPCGVPRHPAGKANSLAGGVRAVAGRFR